ncbi:MAG: hypothetical protein WAO56_06135 [Miniphocaeibacter sp.]|uniref:hypothetical protein n=1 Tax=Miniphocaeibacter sp. TaxID=3100973 RepID=UPI00183AAE7C|nr:DNA repair protein [Gallicola sp.]
MENKGLKKLKKVELLEILVKLSEENDRLVAENKELKKNLEDKNIKIAESGSIAEAALKLSGIFESAEKAVELYLQNIKNNNIEA